MHLLSGFLLALVTIAFVQSRPSISQFNNLNAAIASLSSLQDLHNQFGSIAGQVANTLSSGQLSSLQQQVLQLAKDVINGKTNINTAVQQLLQQVQQQFGSNSQLLNNVQSVIQQLVNTVSTLLPSLASNLGQSKAAASRTSINDLLALADQFQLNNLNAIQGAFPQHAALINQLTSIATLVANTLSPTQLFSLQQQAIQVAENVIKGNTDINTAVQQLLGQLQQHLGSNAHLLNDVQPIVNELVNVVNTLLPHVSAILGQQQTPTARSSINDLLALADQFQLNNLNAIQGAFPQHTALINQLTSIATLVANTLSPTQLFSLQQEAIQVAENVIKGNTDINTAVQQLLGKLQQHLGSNAHLLNNVQPVVNELVNVVNTLLPHVSAILGQQQAPTARTSINDLLALADQFQLNNLNAIQGAFPQHAALINQLTSIATLVANTLSPTQLFSLQQEAIQVAENVIKGNTDIDAAVQQLLGQLQQHLGSNAHLLNNVQPVVNELVNVVNTLLPHVSAILGQH